MRYLFPLAAVLALSACSRGEPDPEPSGAPTPADTAAPPAVAPAQTMLVPDRFHGIWDAQDGDCTPGSDMRTEVAERGITFYESHGAVTGVVVNAPDVITVDLAMQGEGETWTLRRRFTLSNNERTLTPTAVDDEPMTPMPLKRCA